MEKAEFLGHYATTPINYPHEIVLAAWPTEPMAAIVTSNPELIEVLGHAYDEIYLMLKEFKPTIYVRIDRMGSRSFVDICPSKHLTAGVLH